MNFMNSFTQLLVNPIVGLHPKYDSDTLNKYLIVNNKKMPDK
ncbi:MAG: hypothetical protein ACK5HR_04435 [Mycoplasmatales bacterium]